MNNLKLTHINNTAQLSGFVRAARVNQALTQTALGHLIGVRQSRFARIENFTGLVSCEQLMQVLTALRIQLYLCEPTPAHAEKASAESPPAGRDPHDSLW
ncbi:MAG: transcriptional regulator [Pseudomonadota bacterium]